MISSLALFLMYPLFACAEEVLILTDATFDKTLFEKTSPSSSNILWLVEFHAPWCGFCKKLNPILDQVSSLLEKEEGPIMKIAKIDTDAHEEMAKRYDITSYPTLFWIRDGKMHPYRAGRTVLDFMEFNTRMHSPPITPITDMDEIPKNTVVFAIGNSMENNDIGYQRFKELALSFQDAHIFLHLNPVVVQGLMMLKDNKEPFIVKLEGEESPIFYPKKFNNEDEIENDLQEWITMNRFPLFAVLSGGSFPEYVKSGKKVVILCEDPLHVDNQNAVDLVKAIISDKDVGVDVGSSFLFGRLNGVQFSGFLTQYFVFSEDLPKLIVLDRTQSRFWEKEGMTLTKEEIVDFLTSIENGKLPPVYEGFYGFHIRFYRTFLRYYPYSCLGIFPLVFVLLMSYSFMKMVWADDSDYELPEEDKKNQ